jgi:NADPH:quinone reductase-like Zn-dependent oxidoreductase
LFRGLVGSEMCIRDRSTAINTLDALIRNGEFKLFLPYKAPFVLGHDFAGTIIKVGSDVQRFKIGDKVYSRPSDFSIGTFAEQIAVNEKDLAIIPSNISMEQAAGIPLVGLTSWQALVEIANVQPGQKVFIQAGSGGVGTFAIQLAKHLGAYVATTTSSANIDLIRSLGADDVIDYKKDDFSAILKDFDVVLHSNKDVKVLEKSLAILKPGGTLISLTGPPTEILLHQFNLAFYFKIILNLLSASVRRKAKKLNVNYHFLFMQADGVALSEITKLIEAGKIKPVVDRVFSFDQINEAIAYVETGRSKGKVIVKIK